MLPESAGIATRIPEAYRERTAAYRSMSRTEVRRSSSCRWRGSRWWPATASAPRWSRRRRKVLDAVLPGVEATEYDLGAARYHRTGEVLPDSVLDRAGRARRDPARRRRRPDRAARRARARPAAQAAVRLRPVRQPAPVAALARASTGPLASVKPGEIDFVVVREGTEGLYAGAGGIAAPGHPGRGRHRGEPQHPARRRAGHPRRVRPRRPPRAAQGHAGAQDQRADPRRRRCGRARSPRSPPSTPTSPPSTSTSTPRRCSW